MSPPCKILMPTPLEYAPPADRFRVRDAARFSRAFQAMGIHCQKLLIGDPAAHNITAPELRLAPWSQWTDPEWWMNEACDLVLFYGGIAPRMAPALRAIKAAGAILALKMDSGLGAPGVGLRPRLALYGRYWSLRDRGRSATGALTNCILYTALETTPWRRSARLLPLFDLADWITLETPEAVDWFRRWYAGQGRGRRLERVIPLAHPVEPAFRYTPADAPKGPRIVAVGRWGSFQKDGPLLARTLAQVLARHPGYSAVVIGADSEGVRNRLQRRHPTLASKVRARPDIPNAQVRDEMRRGRILLITSRYESFSIAAAEALCCGCSIVAPSAIRPAAYFASAASGSIAATRAPRDLASALRREIGAWENAHRDPVAISRHWTAILHADTLGRRLCQIAGLPPPIPNQGLS